MSKNIYDVIYKAISDMVYLPYSPGPVIETKDVEIIGNNVVICLSYDPYPYIYIDIDIEIYDIVFTISYNNKGGMCSDTIEFIPEYIIFKESIKEIPSSDIDISQKLTFTYANSNKELIEYIEEFRNFLFNIILKVDIDDDTRLKHIDRLVVASRILFWIVTEPIKNHYDNIDLFKNSIIKCVETYNFIKDKKEISPEKYTDTKFHLTFAILVNFIREFIMDIKKYKICKYEINTLYTDYTDAMKKTFSTKEIFDINKYILCFKSLSEKCDIN